MILENWCRFLDYCKIPLDKTKIDPNRLLEILNSINTSIRFKIETRDKELPFLDIIIKRNDVKIRMDIYFKPTDTRRCFPFPSIHPNNCKENIPFPLVQRLCTIVGDQQHKLRHMSKLKENLKKYDYPINITTKWHQESPRNSSK